MKKLITALVLCLVNTAIYAETCPDVKTVRGDALQGWSLHDSDDNKPLNAKRVAYFKKNIEQFTLAEWVTDGKQKGNIRCYYSDKNGAGLEAYLTKESFKPNNFKNYWYQVSGSMHCAAGMQQCLFQHDDLMKQHHLAQR